MRILTVTNQKGGVGKTALALHVALAARERDLRVLLIDLDTQGNAGITLSGQPSLPRREGGSADLFSEEGIEPLETASGIDLLHGHQRLDAIDTSFMLPEAVPIGDQIRHLPYDLVVVDTPPAVCLRQLAPMVWCDLCVVPLEPNGYSVAGLTQTLAVLASARQLNPGLKSLTFINRHILRSSRQKRYIEQIESRVELASPNLTLRVAVADALDAGVPVWKFRRAAPETREQWKTACEGILDASLLD